MFTSVPSVDWQEGIKLALTLSLLLLFGHCRFFFSTWSRQSSRHSQSYVLVGRTCVTHKSAKWVNLTSVWPVHPMDMTIFLALSALCAALWMPAVKVTILEGTERLEILGREDKWPRKFESMGEGTSSRDEKHKIVTLRPTCSHKTRRKNMSEWEGKSTCIQRLAVPRNCPWLSWSYRRKLSGFLLNMLTCFQSFLMIFIWGSKTDFYSQSISASILSG